MSKKLYDYLKKGANLMKYFNKIMIFFLFIMASFARDITAYTYRFTNMVGRNVRISFFYDRLGKRPRLTATNDLIKAYDTRKFSSDDFGWLCWHDTRSSFSIAIRYGKNTKFIAAPIKQVGDELFTRLKNRGLQPTIGAIATIGSKKEINLCRKNIDFILIKAAGTIYAVTK